MKAVVQRVSQASVCVADSEPRSIRAGLVILLGVAQNDTPQDAAWLARKIVNMRIFEDRGGKMNLSLLETGGQALVVSQFTLMADVIKGRRPSFDSAAPPQTARPLYEEFVQQLQETLKHEVVTGEFGAPMRVNLANQGPVTIVIDSQSR